MFRTLRVVFAVFCCLLAVAAPAGDSSSGTFKMALDLVHAYNGSGDQLRRAMRLAEELQRSAPKSGYAQALYAEALSTWELEQDGTPLEVRDHVIQLSDEAIRLNPNLAQAHVSKARAFVRSSLYGQANSAIDAALSIDPSLSGALFLRAEVFRRTGALLDAETWYRRFIASTPSITRKSNGYSWLGTMYEDAAWRDATRRAELTGKARAAYEAALELDPNGAWRNVNFAIFLNSHAADFDAAERYAQRALTLMEFPMARYHLAAARYQKLSISASSASRQMLESSAAEIAESTGLSLEQAMAFPSFSSVVRGRLAALQRAISTK